MWILGFGASSLLVARMVHPFRLRAAALIVAGGVFAFWLVRLPGLGQRETGLAYVFLCGMISICAMQSVQLLEQIGPTATFGRDDLQSLIETGDSASRQAAQRILRSWDDDPLQQ